jgi:HD-GYP domain-containing protein (c-di-GMP phosphodiesterase class II)
MVRTCLELRRIRQEKERLSDLVFMYQFSQMIATSLDIETQVGQIVEFLWQRFAPESLALSMHLPETGKLHLLAGRSAAGWHEPRSTPLAPEFTDQQMLAAHMRLAGGAGTNEESLFAGALLRSHDTPIGYLHMARRAEQPLFDVGERRLLGIFATQVAASLDNARLYQALKDQNRQTIEALAEAIEARDAYTYGHSRQVTRYAVRLAQEIGLSAERIELMDFAGLLHDVGKIGIRDYVLLKPGSLSDEEFAVMKRHPAIGVKIIERVHGLRATLPIIEGHHERVDGKGYPHGLKGEAIPLEARILAIADSFEAMTADRAYRPAMETERALKILLDGRGTHWEPSLVDCFVELIRREGDQLKLSTKAIRQTLVPLIEGQAVSIGDVRD